MYFHLAMGKCLKHLQLKVISCSLHLQFRHDRLNTYSRSESGFQDFKSFFFMINLWSGIPTEPFDVRNLFNRHEHFQQQIRLNHADGFNTFLLVLWLSFNEKQCTCLRQLHGGYFGKLRRLGIDCAEQFALSLKCNCT